MSKAVEVKRDGARCTLSVTVLGAELSAQFSARLAESAQKVRLPGFRPGKAPAALLRRRYGPSVLAETLREVIDQRADKAMEEAGLRPSDRPMLDTPGQAYDLAALDAGRDFAFTLSFEPLPEIALADLKAMAFERLAATPGDKDVDEAMANLAKSRAEEGAEPPALDEDFAKSVGAEGLEQLREEVRKRLVAELASAARTRLKMAVMDALDAAHSFDAPPGLVEREYAGVMEQVERHAKAHKHGEDCGESCETEKGPTDAERQEYREIAGRRVRLGLILAEIATQKNLAVSNEELGQAVLARARMFPGQEEAVFNMFTKNAQMLESVRAPLLEDKAVDFVLEMATVTERAVTPQELFQDDEEKEEEKPKAKKKAPAKKTVSKKKE